MAARITREFLDRMRDDPDFLEATPGDASEAVAIIDLAISALSHPAALERSHKENEEACRYLERLIANVAPPPTKPLAGDLIGLCTQVDNLMCWVRERARAEGGQYADAYAEINRLHAEQLSRLFCTLGWDAIGVGVVRPMRLDDATDSLDKVYDEIAAAVRKKLALVVERARAEGAEAMREACAVWVSDEWKPMDPPGMYEAEALADAYTSGEIDAAASIADCIRHVLPVPRPSPEAEPISTTAESVLHRVMEQAERDLASAHAAICKLQGIDPATHEWPSWSPQANTLRWFDRLRRDYPAAPTPPALAPELWERLAKVLQWAGGLGNSIYSPEARALLSALSPQTDGGAK